MDIKLVFTVVFLVALSVEVNSDSNEKTTKPPSNYNPLEDLILNNDKNGNEPGSNIRIKRQYPYYYGRYPYPLPIIVGGGFFGGGFGRGYGGGFGRGFGGRGFGGRGFGGFGGRGFGGRGGGFGGRGGGFGGFGGRGRG